MKKIICLLFSVLLLITLIGCKKSKEDVCKEATKAAITKAKVDYNLNLVFAKKCHAQIDSAYVKIRMYKNKNKSTSLWYKCDMFNDGDVSCHERNRKRFPGDI